MRPMPDSYIERILRARVYDLAQETPLTRAEGLSRRLGNQVLLKREDLQPVFSFKLRGAYNKLVHLNPEALARGVIAASAGNHAQGVALGAARLGVQATIVMPRTTPAIKVQAVRSFGAKAVLHGDSYDEAYAQAMEWVAARRLTFIHPFDDPDVIAGQGTIAMEMLRQVQTLGADKAGSVLAKITPVETACQIELLDWMDPAEIVGLIKDEHPQIAAVLLANLDSAVAAQVLEGLPEAAQPQILHRIAKLFNWAWAQAL